MLSWRNNLYLPTLILLWALLYLFRLSEAQMKMDAMTYGVLAKHILSTGDWRVLHYTPSAMGDFFMHPPLGIWLTAIAFKLFGVSVVTARVFASVFALGTLLLLLYWGRRYGSPWRGFVAAFVCMTSISFLKFTADLFLDGPLAFFLVAGSLCALRLIETPRAFLPAAGLGVFTAAALMTKGAVGLSLPLAFFLIALAARLSIIDLIRAGSLALVTAAVPLAFWIAGFGGAHYLQEYWRTSVSTRLGPYDWVQHLRPLIGLAERYWPWLIFFVWGVIYYVRRFSQKDPRWEVAMAIVHSLIIVGAYCYFGIFYEHYLLGFYPFAAIVVSSVLAPLLERWQRPVGMGLLVIAVAGNVVLNLLPGRLRPLRNEPLREISPILVSYCPTEKVSEVLFTPELSERWLGTAILLWETPWEATFVESPPTSKSASVLLITTLSVDESWERVPTEFSSPHLYQRRGSANCR